MSEMELPFLTYVRKPFVVEAVQITEENIATIAPLVGELADLDGQTYIKVDRRLVPNVYKVFPGFWLTRMNDKIRCYSDKIFSDQFELQPEPTILPEGNWTSSAPDAIVLTVNPPATLTPD